MSQRNTDDFINLFEAPKRGFEEECLPCRPEAFTLEYEAATWDALRFCFPGATLNGCSTKWVKCLLGKWTGLGLWSLAGTSDALAKIFTRSQALLYLPEDRIREAFQKIKDTAKNFPAEHNVHRYLQYLLDMWIQSAVYPPSTWCQSEVELQTLEDIEACYCRLIRNVGPNPTFYRFVDKMNVELLQMRDQIRSGDCQSRDMNEQAAALADIWQQYEEDDGMEICDVMDSIALLFHYKSGARDE